MGQVIKGKKCCRSLTETLLPPFSYTIQQSLEVAESRWIFNPPVHSRQWNKIEIRNIIVCLSSVHQKKFFIPTDTVMGNPAL